MIERILNKLGLYTEKQYDELNNEYGILELKVFKIEKENKKLKNDYENVVAALKIYEDKKSELLAENEDLRRALENRKSKLICY